jgi:hypothetical protein
VPAAAVIPAPIAYIKVVAVKTFVVELVLHTGSTPIIWVCTLLIVCKRITGGVLICYNILIDIIIYTSYLNLLQCSLPSVVVGRYNYFEQIRVLKAGSKCLNILCME